MAENSVRIIQPAVEALDAAGFNFQVMGSLGLLGFTHPESVIQGSDILAPVSLHKDNFRRPGDLGDVDFRFNTADPVVLAAAQDIVSKNIEENALLAEIFGLNPEDVLQEQINDPFSWPSLKLGVADNYEKGDQVVRAALPFFVPLPKEARKPWFTYVGEDFAYPVPHPGTSVGNYVSRSIAGRRLRNKKTVDAAVERLLREVPGAYEWMMDKDGPGRAQLRLAELFMGVRGDPERFVILGDRHSKNHLILNAVNPKTLREAPEFLFTNAEPELQIAILAITRLKIMGIRPVEQSKLLDAIWSKYIMPYAGPLIHPGKSKSSKNHSTEVSSAAPSNVREPASSSGLVIIKPLPA